MESRRTCSPSVGVATSKSKALLLGMVYSEETEPKRGIHGSNVANTDVYLVIISCDIDI